MYSVHDIRFFTVCVSTFRNLRVDRLFAANRSLSQLVTSFFGSWCQGILLVLLFAWTSFASIYSHISRSLRSLFKNCWVTFNSFWFSYFSPSFHNYLCFDLAKLYFVTLNFKLYLERPNWFQFMSSSLFTIHSFKQIVHFSVFRVLINLFSLFGFQWTFSKLNSSLSFVST